MSSSFASAKDARRFLAYKAAEQARFEGRPLSREDELILDFSVDEKPDPRIPESRLHGEDFEFEERVEALLRAAYGRDQQNLEEAQRYHEAISKLKDGDHYILVMAESALSGARQFTRPILGSQSSPSRPIIAERGLLFYTIVVVVILLVLVVLGQLLLL